MSLSSLLSIARSALLTHKRAMEVTAHNVANAQTPGYSRQRLQLRTLEPVRTPEGEVKERRVKISAEQLETARAHVQAGLEVYIRKANKDWATTITEIENKKRDQIQDAEHYLRKDLHQIKPQNAAIEMVERVTNATTGANSDILAALAKSTMDTNRLLGELVKQGQSGKVAPAAKPAAEPSSEFLGQVCADTTQAGEPCKGRVTKNVDGVYFCSQHPKTQ